MPRVTITALILTLGVTLTTASAQDTQMLKIKNGIVEVNGQVLPDNETPEQFKKSGTEISFSFTGNSPAIIQIDGKLFSMKGNRLTAVDAKDIDPNDTSILVLDGAGGASVFTYGFSNYGGMGRQNTEASQVLSEAFRQQAVRFEELRNQMNEQQHVEGERIAIEMREQARRSADIAAQAPMADTRNYFEEVKVRDAGLYQQMIEESALEAQIYSLAAQVRAAPAGPDREVAVQKLREQLEAAFELKQENRRREVQQLEVQLGQLESNLERRESMKTEIVNRRLNQLLGSNSLNW